MKHGKATLLFLSAGVSLISGCGGPDELPWGRSFASAEQQFQIIRQAQAQESDSAPPEARATFENMQALWGRMSRAQSGMIRDMGRMHGGGMMGHRGGGAGSMDPGRMMQFDEMNQEMLSYCLGMQQMMSETGHADMAAMYGRMADRMRTLRSRLPQSTEPAPAVPTGAPAVADGAGTFAANCASCHGVEGQGVSGVFPPLNGSSVVVGEPETIVKIVLEGLQGPVTVADVTYNGFMPAFGGVLTDAQVAAVATYIRALPSNNGGAVTVGDVQTTRQVTASRTQPWTSNELGLQ